MTQATPPGWYPDPGQKNDGPATERWWDGTAWTDRVRPAGGAAAWAPRAAAGATAGPATGAGHRGRSLPRAPGLSGHTRPAPSARRRRLRAGIAVAAAVAVLAGIGVGVYALTDDGSGGNDAGAAQQDRRGPDDRNDPFGDSGGGGGGGGEDGRSPAPDSRTGRSRRRSTAAR